MVNSSIRQPLMELKDERSRIDNAIAKLEQILDTLSETRTIAADRAVRPGRGRPPGRATRKNARRGLLRETLRKALASSERSLTPTELRDYVLESGYPVTTPKILYTAVYNAAKKDPDIKKTRDGFALRASAKKKQKRRQER